MEMKNGPPMTIMGKQYIPQFPKEFPFDDFNEYCETHSKIPDPDIDFFEFMDEFNAVLFMKYNKDIFVKLMVEQVVTEHREIALGIRCWFERNIPISMQIGGK